MKPGFILGLATAVPAFLVLYFPVGEPKSAFAALAAGIVLSVACELLSPTRLKFTWAKGNALVIWWVVVGIFIGVAEAVAAGGVLGTDSLAGAVIGMLGSLYLGISGVIVGLVVGLRESKRN